MTITTESKLKEAISLNEEEIRVEGPYVYNLLNFLKSSSEYILNNIDNDNLSPIISFFIIGNTSSVKLYKYLTENYIIKYKNMKTNTLVFRKLTH